MDAAEIRIASEAFALASLETPEVDPGLQRLQVCYLSSEAQELSRSILHDRVLPFLEKQLPCVAEGLFGQASGLGDMAFSFSPKEPAVNRYEVGGEFKVHCDAYSVTVNVLLSDPGDFIGGGTAFWPQDVAGTEDDGDEMLLLRPRQGTGVLFNGSVMHSGRQVESGLRHLYVASFHLGDTR
mmetsp:Transcript_158831/g.509218  ORF Transcript_158831/g.509218 Transcript_158831/m.509218 type:complete len:182 (-) Transcript_158831:13-558(-)